MGQAASKVVGKTSKLSSAADKLKRPPIPRRAVEAAAPSDAATNNNGNGNNTNMPAEFLRGEGFGSQDARDMGQEMYWQYEQHQKIQRRKQLGNYYNASAPTLTTNNIYAVTGDDAGSSTAAPIEMPEDLLKFIKNVGPAKQMVDEEFTTRRLFKKENFSELEKLEITRTSRRERVCIPLMENVEGFTTEKNTNFARGEKNFEAIDENGENEDDFGLANIDFYDLLQRKGKYEKIVVNRNSGDDVDHNFQDDDYVAVFCENLLSSTNRCTNKTNAIMATNVSSERKTNKHLQNDDFLLLQLSSNILDIPVLRLDDDNNILGVHERDSNSQTISMMPENKVLLVLNNLSTNQKAVQDKK